MATMRIAVETAKFLRRHPGHAFCDECLARSGGMTVREVRTALVALAGNLEFDQEMWFCSVCLASTPVVHVTWLRFDVPSTAEEAAADAGA